MKLNLGCGRVIFPLAPDDKSPYRKHLEPLPDSCLQPGWANVDKYPNLGVDEVIDLFRFPWVRSSNGSVWNDNSIDEIYCGHIVEHIPHKVSVHPLIPISWMRDYEKQVENLDGFFVFFAEVYRILKPGGLIWVRCPYAMGTPALADPTHTRYIVPGSFSYLAGQNGDGNEAPFDYHLPMHFEIAEPVMARFTSNGQRLVAHLEASQAERGVQLSPDEIANELYRTIDVIDEIRVCLKAIKE